MKLNKEKKYEGFSLVEMLITIVIMGMVLLIASTTLTTLIKTSSASSSKTRVRSETEFVLELIRRTVRNSDPSSVYIYNTEDIRVYNPDTNQVINIAGKDIALAYSTSVEENKTGNEIHFRPYGFESWMCIGFFKSSKDPNMGYILKTSAQNLINDQQSCFENTTNPAGYNIVLNSSEVDINSFEIAYIVQKDNNYLIRFNINAQPSHWYLGESTLTTREVVRQTVVSTEGVVW